MFVYYSHNMARKRGRRRYKKKKTVKAQIYKVLNKTLEKYKMMSFYTDAVIGTIRGANRGLLFSLTGGAHPGLASGLLTLTNDPNMKSLFVMRPLGGDTTTGATVVAEAAGGGGFADGTGTGSVLGTAVLRGRECKLLTWHYRLRINQPDTNLVSPGLSNQYVRLMIFETRRPLSAGIAGGQNWSQQIFYQQHVQALNTAVGQPDEMTAFHNFDIIKKIHLDKLIKLTPGESSGFSYVKRGSVKINKKAHWAYYYDNAAVQDGHLQYMGPFIYMILFSEYEIDDQYRPKLNMCSILTFNDA